MSKDESVGGHDVDRIALAVVDQIQQQVQAYEGGSVSHSNAYDLEQIELQIQAKRIGNILETNMNHIELALLLPSIFEADDGAGRNELIRKEWNGVCDRIQKVRTSDVSINSLRSGNWPFADSGAGRYTGNPRRNERVHWICEQMYSVWIDRSASRKGEYSLQIDVASDWWNQSITAHRQRYSRAITAARTQILRRAQNADVRRKRNGQTKSFASHVDEQRQQRAEHQTNMRRNRDGEAQVWDNHCWETGGDPVAGAIERDFADEKFDADQWENVSWLVKVCQSRNANIRLLSECRRIESNRKMQEICERRKAQHQAAEKVISEGRQKLQRMMENDLVEEKSMTEKK